MGVGDGWSSWINRLRRSGRVIKNSAAGFAELNLFVIGAAQELVNVRAHAHAALHAHLVCGLRQRAVVMFGDAVIFGEQSFRNIRDDGCALSFGRGKFGLFFRALLFQNFSLAGRGGFGFLQSRFACFYSPATMRSSKRSSARAISASALAISCCSARKASFVFTS